MTQEMIRALPDKELSQVHGWSGDEIITREEKRRHDIIAKIRELAAAGKVSVTINGKRGRPPKGKENPASAKAVKQQTVHFSSGP
jgi:hypothetical protein